VKINRSIVAVVTAALVTLGAGMAAAAELAPVAAPKGTHKAPSGHKHPVLVKAPYVYIPPACTLLTCLTPVNTGP
jgi:hypothetical protein